MQLMHAIKTGCRRGEGRGGGGIEERRKVKVYCVLDGFVLISCIIKAEEYWIIKRDYVNYFNSCEGSYVDGYGDRIIENW